MDIQKIVIHILISNENVSEFVQCLDNCASKSKFEKMQGILFMQSSGLFLFAPTNGEIFPPNGNCLDSKYRKSNNKPYKCNTIILQI